MVEESADNRATVIRPLDAPDIIRGLMEAAPDAVLLVDGDGRVISHNSRAGDLFGHSAGELAGQPLDALVPERFRIDDRLRRVEYADHLKPPGPDERIDLYAIRKDGAEFPVEISFRPLVTSEGTITVCYIRDISQRRLAEESARKRIDEVRAASEERFRSAFEHTNVAMVLTSIENRFVRANSAFSRLFGYSAEETLGLSLDDITHPDDLAESHAQRQALLAGERSYFQMEKRYIHHDGHVIWALTNVSLVRDEDGRPLMYVGQVQDITKRKRAEEALRQAQNRLQYLVSSSPAVLFTLVIEDHAIRLTWVSNNIQEMMGYAPQEALHPDWWRNHLHPDDRDWVTRHVRHDLSGHDRLACEFRFRRADGKYRHVQCELRLLHDGDSRRIEAVGSWSDLTDRKHLEEQFRQAQKMEAIGRLAGGVAHDFNNLLTVINGYSEILAGSIHAGDPLREFVEQIRKAGERAASLTRQLLTFSRRQVIAPVLVDLNAVLADMERMLSRLIGEDIAMKLVVKPNLWKVKVDPGQIEQVIMNLVVNARDAMPQGGKLTIETSNVRLDEQAAAAIPDTQPGSFVMLAVSDTGCGMDEATKSSIFEPFFTTKTPDKGTGLGLATVYGIVKQSGGRITVYSERGIGTTFKILLPRAVDEPPSGKSRIIQPTQSRGTETILLVEDEDGVRTLTRLVLEKNGYKVIEARDGAEGLLLCHHHPDPIDIMVTDVVMPNMSGRSLAQHLSKLRPQMKVLYLSGYTDEAIVRHGVIDPDVPFLQKPFTTEALARKVREVLDSDKASVSG